MIAGSLIPLRHSLLPREVGGLRAGLSSARRPAWHRQCKHQHVVKASQKPPELKPDGSGEEEDPTKAKRERELRALLALLVRYPGVYGTSAVVLGYCLHIPALGNFHCDAADALLGLKCAVPVIFLDTLLMLPNYAPATTVKQVKIKVPRAVAEKLASKQQGAVLIEPSSSTGTSSSSSSTGHGGNGAAQANGNGPAVAAATAVAAAATEVAAEKVAPGAPVPGGEDLVEIEQSFPVAAEQTPLLAALYRLQMEKVASNAALGLSPLSELALLFTHHLASEMLWRAVVLTAASSWVSSLLLLAGADDYLFVNFNLDTTQVGAVLAAVLAAACSVAVVVQREVYPLRLVETLEQAARQRLSKGPTGEKAGEGKEDCKEGGKEGDSTRRLTSILSKMRERMTKQRRWSIGVEAARQGTESIAYSAAFLLTGNLLAPYVAACANDLLFSSFQRLRQKQAEKEQVAALERLVSFSSTVAELKKSKVDRLQPSKSGAGSGGGATGSASSSAEAGAQGGEDGSGLGGGEGGVSGQDGGEER